MLLLTPQHWKDYELLDSGRFTKLERFGKYVLNRPEPQAVWDRTLSDKEWKQTAHVEFVPQSSSSGEWKKLRDMPDRWHIAYDHAGLILKFRLGLTSFKHVGIFPEQAANWDFIYSAVKKMPVDKPKVLNLFAYTGGSSLAARAAGADITHLDSIKQVVTWARENMELSGLSDIRWLVEDAMTFVKREIKRGKKYSGIILDPPAFGHGPNGENWKLEDEINEMMTMVAELLEPAAHFLVLNTYSLGFSSLIIENLLRHKLPQDTTAETGELFLAGNGGTNLPLGVFGRSLHVK